MNRKKIAVGSEPTAGITGASLTGSSSNFTMNGFHDQATASTDDLLAEMLDVRPAEQPTPPTFSPYSFNDLLAMPPKEWLIDQVLGPGDIGMIYGAPGCGKTFVVIDLALSACIGKAFAMRFGMARRLNVAYCAGEGAGGLPSRFAAAAHHHGIEELPNFTFYKHVPQLFINGESTTDVSIRQFVAEWRERQEDGRAGALDLLIVDTLATASAEADENSSKDMGKVLQACRLATHELGCAIMLVHHTNKSGTAERGSSSLRGAMDCMLEIRRISDTGTKAVMTCAKLKDGEGWRDQTLDLTTIDDFDSVRVRWDEPRDGTTMPSREAEYRATILKFMTDQPGVKLTAKILAEVAGVEQSNAIRLLSKMVSDGVCESALMDQTKKNSSRNPLTYFVSSSLS